MKSQLRLLAIGFVITSCSLAQQLTLTQTGTGSGTLNGISFPSSSFTLTQIVDPANRRILSDTPHPSGYGYAITDSLVSIAIAGLGDFTVTYPTTQAVVNNVTDMVAFGRAQSGDYSDLLDGPTDTSFSTWDMLTAIGPISGTAILLQWGQFPQVTTSGGILIFDNPLLLSMDSTFTATVIPEPSTCAALVGLAALGFAAYRRRHRQAAG